MTSLEACFRPTNPALLVVFTYPAPSSIHLDYYLGTYLDISQSVINVNTLRNQALVRDLIPLSCLAVWRRIDFSFATTLPWRIERMLPSHCKPQNRGETKFTFGQSSTIYIEISTEEPFLCFFLFDWSSRSKRFDVLCGTYEESLPNSGDPQHPTEAWCEGGDTPDVSNSEKF